MRFRMTLLDTKYTAFPGASLTRIKAQFADRANFHALLVLKAERHQTRFAETLQTFQNCGLCLGADLQDNQISEYLLQTKGFAGALCAI
jgi:hypothetical protein